MRSVKLVSLLSVIILLSSAGAQDTDGDGYDDEYDHRDDVDATLMLKLHQFNTSESEEWDSSNGAPDIWFRVCVDADQERVDCYDSEVWADTYTLGNDWNLSINIPDDSSLITFTIQCRDDDLANDDECDMNSDVEEWELVFVFEWLNEYSMEYNGSGFIDNDTNWKNAASQWEVISPTTTSVDSDGDGYEDSVDDFDNDQTQHLDSDGDGYGDNASGNNPDLYPQDSTQWADSDGDGYGDNPSGTNGDKLPQDSTQWFDSDGDGYGDNASGNNPDLFPQDSTQWTDSDGDGYGDNPSGTNGDKFPQDSTQWFDSDGDGYGNNLGGNNPDLCKNSPAGIPNEVGCVEAEILDSDGDGIIDAYDDCSNSDDGESVDSVGCEIPIDWEMRVKVGLAILGFIISTVLAVKKYRRK